ncbi:hypothetical protein C0J52_09291 [Blattella germanica]|nr:hypothetical protein C0J52_09291 [Blattella germanica]
MHVTSNGKQGNCFCSDADGEYSNGRVLLVISYVCGSYQSFSEDFSFFEVHARLGMMPGTVKTRKWDSSNMKAEIEAVPSQEMDFLKAQCTFNVSRETIFRCIKMLKNDENVNIDDIVNVPYKTKERYEGWVSKAAYVNSKQKLVGKIESSD